MNPSLNRMRRLLVIVLPTMAVLVLVWFGMWAFSAIKYRQVIEGWIEAGRASGYEINYDDRRLFGFPTRIVFRLENLRWKNTDGVEFHSGSLDLSGNAGQWQKFDASFKNNAEIVTALDPEGNGLVLGGEEGKAHVELNTDGLWEISRISLMKAKIGRSPAAVFFADELDASAVRSLTPSKDKNQAGLTLTGDARNITLPDSVHTPFGSKMAKLSLHLRVMGDVPDFRKKESVAAWNKENSMVKFDDLHMEWGPLIFGAKGALGFDDDLQPEGVFTGVIGNHKPVLKALIEQGYIPKRQAGMLDMALNMFSKPSKIDGALGIEVPIAVQLGGLFFGPVNVFTFPAIEWPVAHQN